MASRESSPPVRAKRPQKNVAGYNFRDRVEVDSDQPLVDAECILRSFTRSAFRRNVTGDDVAPFLAVVRGKLNDGYTFEMALRRDQGCADGAGVPVPAGAPRQTRRFCTGLQIVLFSVEHDAR